MNYPRVVKVITRVVLGLSRVAEEVAMEQPESAFPEGQ